MGDALVADVKLTLAALLEAVPESSAPGPGAEPAARRKSRRPTRSTPRPSTPPWPRSFPEDAIVVLESPSSTLALRNQLRLSRPGSYYFSAGGGLGFGLAASVGVQLAQPDRPVVCVLGEGSAQYAITAFWSAVAYKTPVTFLVLRNAEYAILKWFAEVEQVAGAPGLDLPALDVAAVAEGYGVKAHRAEASATRSATRWRRRSPPRSRSWSKSRWRPGCRSSRRGDGAAGAERLLARAAVGEPAPDRAPDEIAAGVAQPLRGELEALLGADRVLGARRRHRPLRLRRQPLPALPAGRGDGARRRRRRQGPRLRPRAAASRSPSAPAAPASTARARATASSSTCGATSAASRSRRTAPSPGSSPAPCSATPTASSPRTGASSAPTRPAPTSPPSAA